MIKVTVQARRNLEIITNLAVLIVCLTGMAMLLRVGVMGHLSDPKSVAGHPEALKQGQIFRANSTLGISGPALVLALSTTCHFCAESLPFYKRLEETHRGPGAPPIVLIFPDSKSDVDTFLRDLSPSTLAVLTGQDFSAIGVAGTPTVLLLDAKGVIQKVWRGKLSTEKEREIMDAAGFSM